MITAPVFQDCKKLAAYHLPPSLGIEEWRSPPQILYLRVDITNATTPDLLPKMGRRSQKPLPGTLCNSRDIGSLLQRQAQSKMAAQDAYTAITELQAHTQEKAPSQPKLPGCKQTPPIYPDFSTLASKQDMKTLLADFRQTLEADTAVIQTDLQMVTDRVCATEENIIVVKQAVSTMRDSQVQKAQQAFSIQHSMLDA
ncbi:Hypothetical predicted protein [Pelobates cultripes]|uniref:Uncharacterized protein n=1 Tax=Pelobates cultripes TaxID=61616 RepID=A0AAD1RLE9_PELCU|nr:Hypothetical predicted protein [Pelobates cultripes]